MRLCRRLLLALIVTTCAAPAQDVEPNPGGRLELARVDLLDRPGGYAVPEDSVFYPGETVNLAFNIRNYAIDEDYRISLTWRVEAVGPHGNAFATPEGGEFNSELSPQDEGWEPLVTYHAQIPEQAPGGVYELRLQVIDHKAEQTVKHTVPVRVDGQNVELSDSLTVRNFGFSIAEGGTKLAQPIYRPGQQVHASFYITGYQTRDDNTYDVSSEMEVIDSKGKRMYYYPAKGEKGSPFFPRLWLPAKFRLDLEPNIPPGTYKVILTIRDKVGEKTFVAEEDFEVR